MYYYLTYPFDVIKTNRIINSSWNKECGENITKEISSLQQRGQFRNGLYRGVLPYAGICMVQNLCGGFNFDVTGIKLLAYTTLSNPLHTVMTHR